jgi:transposase
VTPAPHTVGCGEDVATSGIWIGLDVGADELSVCGTDDEGTVMFEQLVPTRASALTALLGPKRRRIKLIGLESSPYAVLLVRSLRNLKYPVAVFEARQASKFLAIRRNKSDKNDARGLAELARLGRGSVSEVRIKSPECQRLRSMLVTRKRLVELRVTIEGTMRSLFRLNGGRLKSSSSAATLKKNVANELKRIHEIRKIDLTEDSESLLALSEALRTYLEAIDKKLSKMAKEHLVCRRFLAITGVGPLCALSFYSAVEDPTRFKRSADIGPYLGMVPLIRQSGQTITRRHISKMGDRMTRSLLVTAALHHLRYGNSALSAWGGRLAERSGKGLAQVAVARKLAVVMISMWKANTPYDPKHGAVAKEPIAA